MKKEIITSTPVIEKDNYTRYYADIDGYSYLHREDGPAVIGPDGESWWYKNQLHRLDGPAVIRKDGYKAWYKNHRFHRLDGPAIIYSTISHRWYIEGRNFYCFKSYLEAVKPLITEQEYFILVLTYGTEK